MLTLPVSDSREVQNALDAGIWSENELGFVHQAVHWEWYGLEALYQRLAICAPREHAKSQTFSVNGTAHMAIYRAASWQYLFSATVDQGQKLLERVVEAISRTRPDLLATAPRLTHSDVILGNWSRVSVGSVGKSMRGIHPDRIVGDDVLDESSTQTSYQRRMMESWWFGAVGPMAHPGVERPVQWGNLRPPGPVQVVEHPPTKIILVGTPFHQLDLLMGMRENPIYVFRRYAAEFRAEDLVPGTFAVEATDIDARIP